MSATKKTSVSLSRELLPKALKRAESLGFKRSFSAYLERLIERDLINSVAVEERIKETLTAKASVSPKIPPPTGASETPTSPGARQVPIVQRKRAREKDLPRSRGGQGNLTA